MVIVVSDAEIEANVRYSTRRSIAIWIGKMFYSLPQGGSDWVDIVIFSTMRMSKSTSRAWILWELEEGE